MTDFAPTVEPDSPEPEQQKRRPHRPNMYGEARELQLLVLADARQEDLKPFIRAQLVRAYKELAELRLRLQGKGPPKAVDYSARSRRKPAARGFTELPQDKAKPAAVPPSTESQQDKARF